MKGKYAAKAKNRLANLDNEILREVIAERDELRSALTEERRRVESLERDIDSRSMREAQRLAGEEVRRLEVEVSQLRDRLEELPGELAFGLMELVTDEGNDYRLSSGDGFVKLAELFGVSDRLGELLLVGRSDSEYSRRVRRASTGKMKRILSQSDQYKQNPGLRTSMNRWGKDD